MGFNIKVEFSRSSYLLRAKSKKVILYIFWIYMRKICLKITKGDPLEAYECCTARKVDMGEAFVFGVFRVGDFMQKYQTVIQ